MGISAQLQRDVGTIFSSKFTEREGQVVPEAEDVGLNNDAVHFDEAVVMYADLVESTGLVDNYPATFAAKVYKSYLHCASRIIREEEGEISAFDGDRIMAVFLGKSKCTSACRAALKINDAVKKVINPAINHINLSSQALTLSQFILNPPENHSYTLRHCVGIDMSELFVARTGIRGSNDLVWVGRAANYAAKLCAIRDEGYSTFITTDVYNRAHKKVKFGGNPRRGMWQNRNWQTMNVRIYRSNWTLTA